MKSGDIKVAGKRDSGQDSRHLDSRRVLIQVAPVQLEPSPGDQVVLILSGQPGSELTLHGRELGRAEVVAEREEAEGLEERDLLRRQRRFASPIASPPGSARVPFGAAGSEAASCWFRRHGGPAADGAEHRSQAAAAAACRAPGCHHRSRGAVPRGAPWCAPPAARDSKLTRWVA